MKIWSLVILQLVLSSCASNVKNSPELAQATTYPDNWPNLIEKEFGPHECVVLNGEFYSSGLSKSNISGTRVTSIFERNFFYLIDIANASNVFKVIQDVDEKVLIFAVYDQNKNLLASNLTKNYSKCESGRLVQESFLKGGSGDNPVRSQNETTSYYLAEDGSLIINTNLIATSSKFIVGRKTEVSDTWFKFEKVRE